MVYTLKLFPLCWIIKILIDLAGWILEKKRIVCKLCIVNNIDTFECKKKKYSCCKTWYEPKQEVTIVTEKKYVSVNKDTR